MTAHLDGCLPPEAAPGAACVHHWLIGGAVDDLAEGTCRHCGKTREFTNVRRGWGGREPVSAIPARLPYRPA